MEIVSRETPHVAGLATGMGDPSPFTARGVLRAMEAVAVEAWGAPDLADKVVAIQGLGNVGRHLAEALHEEGARLVVTDVVPDRVRGAVEAFEARSVAPEDILDAEADIFAPCALGGVLDDEAVVRLRVQAVCGGANNQLLAPEHGDRLVERGILYVPDYVANAGGVISGGVDIAGWDRKRFERALDGIFDTVRQVFATSRRLGVGPHVAADRLAEEWLEQVDP
jgi:leucine dehydrogenase